VPVRERVGAVVFYVEASLLRGFEHRQGGVHPLDPCSSSRKLFGKSAISAAYVENLLSGLSGKQIDDA
jgi:hypothetical protein